jgi:hypothetical protein
MIVDFGETFFSQNFEIKDAAGVLANAGTVTATVTLPDATTTSPTVNNPSAGIYNFNYLTTQAGLHDPVLVSATGGVLGGADLRWTDSFYVAPTGSGSIIPFDDAKAHLNIPGSNTVSNEELRPFLRTATEVVEHFSGPCVRRTYTDEVQGGRSALVLHRDQVVSITSVTPILTSAPTVTLADLDVSPTGIIRHKAGQAISWGTLRVVYIAGRGVIPWALMDAAKIITAHLWDTQRGPRTRTFLGQEDRETTFVPQYGFAIPNRAMDLMHTHPAPAGIA